MAAQTSASSSRASAKQAQRRAKRSESLSGSMRQFLTPEVWKQVKHAASQHGCRNGVRWTLQPLIMIAAIMTWCAGETDADRFVLSRSFYVQIHCPKRQRPGKAFSGFCKAMLHLPMPVWWAFCDAVRSRVFRLLADRMTMEGWLPLGCDGLRMECPRTTELEQSLGKSRKDKSAPTLWVIALVSLTTGVPGPALGDVQNGGTSLPDRSVGDAPPSGPPKRALGLRRGLRGLRFVRSFAQAAVLVSDPALFAGTTLQPGDGQGGGIHRGRVLVLDRRCREQEQASVARPGDPRGDAECKCSVTEILCKFAT